MAGLSFSHWNYQLVILAILFGTTAVHAYDLKMLPDQYGIKTSTVPECFDKNNGNLQDMECLPALQAPAFCRQNPHSPNCVRYLEVLFGARRQDESALRIPPGRYGMTAFTLPGCFNETNLDLNSMDCLVAKTAFAAPNFCRAYPITRNCVRYLAKAFCLDIVKDPSKQDMYTYFLDCIDVVPQGPCYGNPNGRACLSGLFSEFKFVPHPYRRQHGKVASVEDVNNSNHNTDNEIGKRALPGDESGFYGGPGDIVWRFTAYIYTLDFLVGLLMGSWNSMFGSESINRAFLGENEELLACEIKYQAALWLRPVDQAMVRELTAHCQISYDWALEYGYPSETFNWPWKLATGEEAEYLSGPFADIEATIVPQFLETGYVHPIQLGEALEAADKITDLLQRVALSGGGDAVTKYKLQYIVGDRHVQIAKTMGEQIAEGLTAEEVVLVLDDLRSRGMLAYDGLVRCHWVRGEGGTIEKRSPPPPQHSDPWCVDGELVFVDAVLQQNPAANLQQAIPVAAAVDAQDTAAEASSSNPSSAQEAAEMMEYYANLRFTDDEGASSSSETDTIGPEEADLLEMVGMGPEEAQLLDMAGMGSMGPGEAELLAMAGMGSMGPGEAEVYRVADSDVIMGPDAAAVVRDVEEDEVGAELALAFAAMDDDPPSRRRRTRAPTNPNVNLEAPILWQTYQNYVFNGPNEMVDIARDVAAFENPAAPPAPGTGAWYREQLATGRSHRELTDTFVANNRISIEDRGEMLGVLSGHEQNMMIPNPRPHRTISQLPYHETTWVCRIPPHMPSFVTETLPAITLNEANQRNSIFTNLELNILRPRQKLNITPVFRQGFDVGRVTQRTPLTVIAIRTRHAVLIGPVLRPTQFPIDSLILAGQVSRRFQLLGRARLDYGNSANKDVRKAWQYILRRTGSVPDAWIYFFKEL